MIEIYSKTTCPYCNMAKQYLKDRNIEFEEIIYDDDEDRNMMYDNLELTGRNRTVPQIFFIDNENRTRIGGYNDLIKSDVVANLMVRLDIDF